jgi:carbon monoxide dehydrogenase subunit G
MTRIESNQAVISKSPNAVFTFLSDFNNFRQIMPEQVTDWTSDSDSCSFTIKGMATLGMAIESRIPDSEIRIKKNGKAPFDFFLICKIGSTPDPNQSTLQLLFDADLNPMLKMMAEKPLTNFLNMLVNKFSEIAGSHIA